MTRVFITGSSDGLGRKAAQMLAEQGHSVVLHARNAARGKQALAAVPGAETVLLGDLASIAQTRALAAQVNQLGHFDAAIHNAGMGYGERKRVATEDGLPEVFAVNTLAPYILTALIDRPQRLIYLSSGLHRSGDASLKDLAWEHRSWNGQQAYSDTKLHDVLLAIAVARRWKNVFSNALEPGWVPTKMGGPGAPESLEDGSRTQVWLAASNAPTARVTGEYFYHMKTRSPAAAARDIGRQDRLIEACESYSAREAACKLNSTHRNIGELLQRKTPPPPSVPRSLSGVLFNLCPISQTSPGTLCRLNPGPSPADTLRWQSAQLRSCSSSCWARRSSGCSRA